MGDGVSWHMRTLSGDKTLLAVGRCSDSSSWGRSAGRGFGQKRNLLSQNDWMLGPAQQVVSNYQRHVLPYRQSEKKFLAETIHVSNARFSALVQSFLACSSDSFARL